MPETPETRGFRPTGPLASPLRRRVAAAGVPETSPTLFLTGLAVIGVLYFARDILIPLVLAVLLAFVLAPVVAVVRRVGVPRGVSVVAAVLLAVVILAGLGVLLGTQLASLAADLPYYQYVVGQKLGGAVSGDGGLIGRVTGLLEGLGRSLTATGEDAAAAPAARGTAGLPPLPVEVREPTPGVLTVLQRVVGPLLGPVALTGIVFVFSVFLLLYREDLRDRLIKLVGSRDLQRTTAAMNEGAERLSRFFLAITLTSSAYGTAMTLALWAVGVPNPILWGVITGLMRFVPFIGTPIAVAFPALLAVAVDPGWGMLFMVLGLYALGEGLMGQVVEPLVFGHSTGLSPVAVLLATAFWAWLWGPVGLLLATPLTVGLVVLGRHAEQLEFLEVMLSDRQALSPPEAFYQRALAGDGDGLAEQADLQLRTGPLAAYYDEVALPGLALAQADAARGLLDRDRLETVRARVAGLLDDLEDHEEDPPPATGDEGGPAGGEGEATRREPPAPVPPGWRGPGAVLCVAGRGRLDAQATAMLVQSLRQRGFGAEQAAAEALRPGGVGAVPGPPPRAVLLSALDGGSGAASARYALRRLRRRFPGAVLVTGLWGAGRESPVLAALREEGGEAARVACGLAEADTLLSEIAAGEPGSEAGTGGPAAPGPADGSAPEAEAVVSSPGGEVRPVIVAGAGPGAAG